MSLPLSLVILYLYASYIYILEYWRGKLYYMYYNITSFFALKLSVICFHFIGIKEKSRCQAYLIRPKKKTFHYGGFENRCEIYIFNFSVYRISDVKTLLLNFKVRLLHQRKRTWCRNEDFTSVETRCKRMWTYHIMAPYIGCKLMWKIISNWCKKSFL